MMEKINKKDEKPSELPIEQEWPLPLKVEKLESENKELNIKLENMKKLFRIIAHDLINPIGNNSVFSDILLDGVKDGSFNKEELVENLEAVSKNSKTTLKLLEDLLTWSRLNQDGIKPEILKIKLEDQVKNSIAPLQSIADQKYIKIKNEISEDVEIFTDSSMLKTLIRNLSSNAIKFTKEGGEISISSVNNNDNVEIYIKDNGVGMTEEQTKKLFETVGKSNMGTNNEKGTGFGLSICREITEKLGGTIRVESEGKDKGTTFIISLPSVEK